MPNGVIFIDWERAMPPDPPPAEVELVGSSFSPMTPQPPTARQADADDDSGGSEGDPAEFKGFTYQQLQEKINCWRDRHRMLPDGGEKMRIRLRLMEKELAHRHAAGPRKLICGGCRTLLMYTRNTDTVRCSCCSTVNLVRPVNNIAHVICGQCRTTLMYPYGAPSVKCAVCNYITNIGVNTVAPTPSPRPTSNGSSYNVPSTSAPTSQPQNVTVVVENPMTVDEKGKLVSNVVVGVTTGKK